MAFCLSARSDESPYQARLPAEVSGYFSNFNSSRSHVAPAYFSMTHIT